MPLRKIPLVTGEVYHVFNRGIGKQPIFTAIREYKRAMLTLNYYRFASPPMRLSRLLLIGVDEREKITQSLVESGEKLVDVLSFCLMPNHFHFLLRQDVKNGISSFVGQIQNSYTKYFNTRNEREGPLLLNQFKAVRIGDDNQILHVSRYIHINPYTSFVVKNFSDIVNYPWSSFREYVSATEDGICERKTVLSHYQDKAKYREFVLNNADYQRELDRIKHLILEK